MPSGGDEPVMQAISEMLADVDEIYRKRPRGAYDATSVGRYEFLAEHIDKIHCAVCADGEIWHWTCSNCLYHGEPDEPGECVQCPECGWGYAT